MAQPEPHEELPGLDSAAVETMRRFLPAKWANRIIIFLVLTTSVTAAGNALEAGGKLFDAIGKLPIPPALLPQDWRVAVPAVLALAAAFGLFQEWQRFRQRRATRRLALASAEPRPGYFRIGPYEDRPEDRAAYRRVDGAPQRVLEWLEKDDPEKRPLYLSGHSGAGKSSLLNAALLPALRERGWTVVTARAYQDPEAALREALLRERVRRGAAGPADPPESLLQLAEAVAAGSPGPLLLLLDQFEEFLILAPPEAHARFAALVAELDARPARNIRLLLVLREEYLPDLDLAGFPAAHLRANCYPLSCFTRAEASRFVRDSGLPLAPADLQRLVDSAGELDGLGGKVRPITLNVLGHVLENGGGAKAGLDAGRLVRGYLAQAVEQPGVRDHARPVLEQLITGQATKRPRSEAELAAASGLKPREVRAVLRGLHEAWLARPLDATRGVWELSHDFIARAVSAYLGRPGAQLGRSLLAWAGPALVGGLLAVMAAHYATVWIETRPLLPEMVTIPAGEFCMGSRKPGAPAPADCPGLPEDPEANDNATPARWVRVPAFQLGPYEVTAGEYRRYVKAMQARGQDLTWSDDAQTLDALPPAERALKDRLPAVNVSYKDAVAYADWLWEETGRKGPKYRLPTEAEWEYAARAGTVTRRWWGDDAQHQEACAHANVLDRKALGALKAAGYPITWDGFACESDGYVLSAPVGRYGAQGANGFGLHDMLGNVFEWVADCYHGNYQGAPPGPGAWGDGTECASGARVIRGGSWLNFPVDVRSANRNWSDPGDRYINLGFRLARDP